MVRIAELQIRIRAMRFDSNRSKERKIRGENGRKEKLGLGFLGFVRIEREETSDRAREDSFFHSSQKPRDAFPLLYKKVKTKLKLKQIEIRVYSTKSFQGVFR